MQTKEIRERYLQWFEQQGHKRVPSVLLVPENDPTTLFTGSGMQPMMPFLLGEQHPLGTRITDSQKCFRSVDIDEVGDNRHTTFFEMLGNWSFGDYFKKEQIPWMFSFLVDELKLDPKNIYVTVFKGNKELPKDEESIKIWQEEFKKKGITASVGEDPEKDGLQEHRIFPYDEEKNWWSRAGIPKNMPIGEPGGPDSEMFYDFGEALQLHENSEFKDQPCHVNCDCGRFLEIGNNVFMTYKKTEKGFEDLPKKNVDFGGGLERMSAAVNKNPDVFLIDVFEKARTLLEEKSGKQYGKDEHTTEAMRVILDHLRAATFLVQDKAPPSNKDQGYFTRRLIRRAVRYGHTLNITSFCKEVSKAFIETYQDAYELDEQLILEAIGKEEEVFLATLQKGLNQFARVTEGKKALSGKNAFLLFQSYGFPIEMTEELAEEKGVKVDVKGFEEEFTAHKSLSKAGAEQKFKGGLQDSSEQTTKLHTATHLLNEALREVISPDIKQKGSNITAERLRFDFNCDHKLTEEELKKVEAVVNEKIQQAIPITKEEMNLQDALSSGAQSEFGAKYPDKVTVYTIGDFSKEICMGPHVNNTKDLGHFKIIKEESSAAGIRRIKAVVD